MTRKRHRPSEPQPEGDEWVEFGGQLILPAGYTSGGAPYGTTLEEFRRDNEEVWEPQAGWALAKCVLRRILQNLGYEDADDRIGFLRFLGEGLTYSAYTTDCRLRVGTRLEDKRVVVRLPRKDAPGDQTRAAVRAMRLLAHLASIDFPARLPTVLGGWKVANGIAVVQEMVDGIPLDMRIASRALDPVKIIAEAAACCHSIDPTPLEKILKSFPTRRQHAASCLSVFDGLEMDGGEDCRAWAQAHLPEDEPSRLVHGDLLGQNLRFRLDGITAPELSRPEEEPIGILDWEEAFIGDPAYDLAIVTRGVRRPFKDVHGLQKLLTDYNSRSPVQVKITEVRVHELCLLAGFCHQHAASHGKDSPHAQNTRRHLKQFLDRL